jgi:membrane protein implicated in regulation of membrane protease activity
VATPSLRDRTRPLELLGLSGVLALFAGLVVLMSTRDLILALIFLGIAFIVALVVLAMLSLAVGPTVDEQSDHDEQDRDDRPLGH